MSYGAQARRGEAVGGAVLSDTDIFNVAYLIRARRGVSGVHSVRSFTEFKTKLGGLRADSVGSYVIQSMYDAFDNGVNVESVIANYVADDAVQAVADIEDRADSRLFTLGAGYKGRPDRSFFGNDLGYKSRIVRQISFLLREDIVAGAESAILNGFDNKISTGTIIEISDGTNTEAITVLSTDAETNKITFAPITNGFSASGSVLYRIDWELLVGLKENGVYVEKEAWVFPYVKSSDHGIAGVVNNQLSGSQFITLLYNGENTTSGVDSYPKEAKDWTALKDGSDGQAPNDSDWKELISSLDDSTALFMAAPESSSIEHNVNMANHATKLVEYIYYATAPKGANADSLKNFGAHMRRPVVKAMLPMDKWIEVDDPYSASGKRMIPPVGVAIAHWYNSFVRYGEGRVAAGNRVTLNISGGIDESNQLIHDDKAGVGSTLIKEYSINIARYQRGKGVTINSARTFSTDKGYMYQNQILMWLMYKKAGLEYLRTIEQDPAGSDAQEDHYVALWGYFKKKYDAGFLFKGQKEDGAATTFEDVVIIANDISVNSLADIANGKEVNFAQFIARPPIEEPILELVSAPVTAVRA